MGTQAEMLVAELLMNLSSDANCVARLVEKGATLPLMKLCTSKNPTVLDNAAGALAKLSALESNRPRMMHQVDLHSAVVDLDPYEYELSDLHLLFTLYISDTTTTTTTTTATATTATATTATTTTATTATATITTATATATTRGWFLL
jgi:hypothetical protein